MFTRRCPQCGKELHYKQEKQFKKSEESGKLCSGCARKGRSFKKVIIGNRNCYLCNKVITYMTKSSYETSIKLRPTVTCEDCQKKCLIQRNISRSLNETWERKCPQCGNTYQYKTKQSFLRSTLNNSLCNPCTVGNKNKHPKIGPPHHLWGKKLSEEHKLKIKKNHASKSPNFKPTYGRPHPPDSWKFPGGWMGWYKNVFFRSLKELSYMVDLDKSGKKWISAEKVFSISYTFEGITKNYRPDFLVEDTILVEIKPNKLILSSELIKTKTKAAERFCQDNNLTYLITDIIILPDEEIFRLYNEKLVRFIKPHDAYYWKRLDKLTNPIKKVRKRNSNGTFTVD